MRAASCISLGIVLLLAGCASEPAAPSTRPAPVSAPDAPPSPTPDAEGAFAAPEWRVGDWWRWRVEANDGPAVEVTTVVAAADERSFVLGVDALEPALGALARHALALGVVERPYSWEVHDQPTRVLSFPLAHGASWEGEMEGRAMTFSAKASREVGPNGEVDAFDVVGLSEEGIGVSFAYAPALRNFLRFSVHYGNEEPYSTATLLGHGGGARRAIVVTSDDMLFAFDRLHVPPRVPDPDARATFDAPAHATHLFLACYAAGQGEQRMTVAHASGAALECARSSPLAEGQGAFATDLGPSVAGTWAARATAAGGFVEAEVYALTVEERAL